MSIFSGSLGGSYSSNKSSSSQDVWGGQSPFLKDMYGAAGDLYGSQAPFNQQFQNFGMNTVNPYMASLNPYMMQGFGNQMGGGQQGQAGQQINPELMKSLQGSLAGGQSNMGKMYQDIVGGPGNTYIDPIVDDMYNSAWKNLDQGAFKKSAQGAAASGNMGNYNRQMDNASFASNMMNDVRAQENQLRGGAYDTDMNWKMNIANLADSNIGAAQDRSIGLLQGGDRNQQGAMQSGNMMQQMGMGMMNPWMAMQQMPWMGMNSYSNAIGDPTVLGSSKSSGRSFGADTSGSFM